MLLTKRFLNEQVQRNILLYEHADSSNRTERNEYDVFISYSWNDMIYADKVGGKAWCVHGLFWKRYNRRIEPKSWDKKKRN